MALVKKRLKKNKMFGKLLIFLLVVLLAFGIPGFFIITGVREAASRGKSLVLAYEKQDFSLIKSEIRFTKNALQKVNIPLTVLFWMKFIPFVGGYYQDAKSLAQGGVYELEAIEEIFSKLEPNKGELGFNGVSKSGPERIVQSIKLLEKSAPFLDNIESKVIKAADLVRNIDTGKYPQKFRGKDVRKNIDRKSVV